MAGPAPACMRATWPKLALAQAKKLSAAELEHVRVEIGEALWQEIKSASIVEWLPAETFMRLCEAFTRALGPTGARALWRDTLVVGFERALLKPLVAGALTLYGRTPGSVLRMAPQAWLLVTRNVGTVRVEREESEHRTRVLFEGLTPVFRRSSAAVEVFHANCDAVLRYLNANGRVVQDVTSLGAGRAMCTVTWSGGSLPPPRP